MTMRLLPIHSIALLALGAASVAACAGEDAPPGVRLPGAASTTTVTSGSSATGGGGEGGGAASTGAGASGAANPGELVTVTVPDTTCAEAVAVPVDLLPVGSDAPLFQRLLPVGTGWVAGEGSGLPGFVPFDLDGAGAELPPVTLSDSGEQMASEGAHLGAAAYDAGEAVYQRYDELGAPAGARHVLGAADAQASPEVAGGDDEALVVWGDEGTLVAQSLQGGAPVGEAFEVGPGGYTSSAFIAVAHDQGTYGIVWSAFDGNATTSYFARADAQGLLVTPRVIFTTPEPHRVIRVAATSAGYAVLLTGPSNSLASVVLLDDQGVSRDGRLHQLEGAFYGWDLVARDDTLAVLAARESGEPELRLFDADLTPDDGWVCLGEPGDLATPGALALDGEGYAALLYQPTAADPQEEGPVFLRLDATGR